MADHRHIDLAVEGAKAGGRQPVEVEPLGDDEYRVLYSPGLVEGIAAGDVIRVTDFDRGLFQVVTRGGNIAVKFAAREPIAGVLPGLRADLEALGARLDGAIGKAAVWTIPLAAGFAQIETVMSAAVARTPGSGWWYGNVYDEGGDPLHWWEKAHDGRQRR